MKFLKRNTKNKKTKETPDGEKLEKQEVLKGVPNQQGGVSKPSKTLGQCKFLKKSTVNCALV